MKVIGSVFLFLFFFTGVLCAQGEPAKVREGAMLVQKELSVWRTDQAASSKLPVYACQAVRLDENWFLTAAHCVYHACNGGLPCTVQITLAQGELRQRVRVFHSNNTPKVFIYNGFYPGQNRISSVDVALVRLDPPDASYSYESWQTDHWEPVSQKNFQKMLRDSPETKAQLAAKGVRLVSAAGLANAHFLPRIVVPKMTEGSLSYLLSPSTEVYFVRRLQHFISPGFGVRGGNSGGGVFTAQGDLAGIVSSLFYAADGSAAFEDEEGKTVLTLRGAGDYFLFTGFNGSTLNFIRNRVPHLRTIGAENGFAVPTEKNFEQIIKSIDGKPMVF